MKIYEIYYSEEFWGDIKEVLYWYDSVSHDLGTKFLNQLWLAESQININPNAFSKVTESGFRRCVLKKFPYKIFFKIKGSKIFITALIHQARADKFVRKRLK